MIPTIIEYYDNKTSVCSYWRGRGPLSELSRQGQINLIEGTWNEDEWDTLRLANIAFFQRPMNKEAFNQIAKAKDYGLKIIIDLDDHNEIPVTHEVYDLWNEMYDEKTFQKTMMLADVVTVSTQYLKDYYLRYNNNVVVVPNAINDYWLKPRKFSTNKIVLIRAGKHHLPDIWEYKNEIIEVMNNNPEWKLYSLGSELKFFEGKIASYEFKGDFNIHQYFAFLFNHRPGIFLVPLLDNELNRGKSNIAWQEATLCGATAITPKHWKLQTCSLTYKDKKTFKDSFRVMIENEIKRSELHAKSLELVKSKYLLSNVNKLRLDIIKKLI